MEEKEEILGAELVKFLDSCQTPFHITEQEADLLCGYVNGQGSIIGKEHGRRYLGDVCRETDQVLWEETTIDDLADMVCEWNFALLQEAKKDLENPDRFLSFTEKQKQYEKLCADEKVLNALFDRTVYGKQIEEMAQKIAGCFVDSIQLGEDIDRAAEIMAKGIKAGQQELAAGKTVPKQKKGKGR